MGRRGAMLLCGLGFALAPARGEEVPPGDPPLKAVRSTFDIREFQSLFNDVLLVPHPRGSLPRVSLRTRTLHGRVVDHEGRPIVDVQVGLANPTDGHYGSDALENFDMTDELGRFLVQDNDGRRRLVVVREPRHVWNATLAGDETYLDVEWPKPGRVRIVVGPALVPPSAKVMLRARRTRDGVVRLVRDAVALDGDGAATFENLPPNAYRAYTMRRLPRGEDRKPAYVERELGRFMIEPGDDREERFDVAARIPVRGNVGPDDEYVEVAYQPTRTSDVAGGVDGELVGEGGEFLVHVSEPGVYRLTIHARPVRVDGQVDLDPQFFPNGVVPEGPIYFSGNVTTRRFVVDETATAVELTLDESAEPTVRFVHGVLDRPHPAEWNYSFSWHDGQIAKLVRHRDRAGVAAELLRIAGDPHAPSNWWHSALTALEDMTETPGVIDGLLVLLDDPLDESSRTSIIVALQQADSELERIVDGVAAFADDDNWVVRSRVRSCLSWIASQHPEMKERIAPTLMSGLDDTMARNREAAAASLGWLKVDEAADALRELLDDPREDVRLTAARAVWQVEGDHEPLVELATVILWREDDDWEPKRDAAYALRDVRDLPQETLAALMLYLGHDGEAPFPDEQSGLLNQLSAAAGEILAAHGVDEDSP
jgi:hypothetical protein